MDVEFYPENLQKTKGRTLNKRPYFDMWIMEEV